MIDGVNRAILLVVGLLLAAAGVGVLAARYGWMSFDPDRPGVVYDRLASNAADEPTSWAAVIIGSSVVVGALAVMWLRAQFVRRGGRGIGTQSIARTERGTTDVDPAPIAAAVARDFESVTGVHRSSVRLLALRPVAEVVVRLDLIDLADAAVVRTRAEAVFERLRATLDASQVDADLRLRLAAGDRSRVR